MIKCFLFACEKSRFSHEVANMSQVPYIVSCGYNTTVYEILFFLAKLNKLQYYEKTDYLHMRKQRHRLAAQ